MKPIRVLSPALDYLYAEIDNYESLQFTKSWHGVGSLELHINRYKKYAEELQKNRLIRLANDKVAIIKHREIALDEKGKASENWLIKAIELKGILGQRITIPPPDNTTGYDYKSGDAETVMKHYVERNLVNPDNPDRKIPNLVIATNQNRGSQVTWQSRYKNVDEELESISLISGLGWDVFLMDGQWVFDVFEGADRTVNQSVNPPVIFSPDFESVKAQGFADSDLQMKNYGYIGGQGEGAAREVIEIGSSTGLERLETFVDARDVSTTTELTERGNQKMDELKTELYFEAEIITPVTRHSYEYEHDSFINSTQSIGHFNRKTTYYSAFRYEQDWFLGDLATIQNKSWGVTMHPRITEVKEIYEPSGFKLEATFNQNRPTLISKLKKELSDYDKLLKR